MPNQLTTTGLQTAAASEIISLLTSGFQGIYGTTINIASSTPDGQAIGMFQQMVSDVLDVLVTLYNSFDPDQAYGVTLDQRVAINGIQRQAGTYTVTPITIINSSTVTLYGLDQTAQSVYTVQDNAGNQWQLQTTQTGVAAGTHVYSFQAAVPGAQLTIPNTITTPITIVLGVTSVNNPSAYSVLGVNEETDYALRLRRQKSVATGTQGYLAGLYAALQNLAGMSSAYVYENLSGAINSDGTPPNTIWVITSGSATAASIATAIYSKRSAGCGMRGAQTYNITQVDGTTFPVYYDVVAARNLFISFTATSINGTTPPNLAAILAQLPTLYIPNVYSEVDINTLGTYVRQIDPNCLVTYAGFSEGDTQNLPLSGVPASGTFKIVYNGNATAAINWNDTTPTIQTKLQAVTGLANATITGTLAGQSLAINTATIGNVLGLLYVTANSLQTAASVAITFSLQAAFLTTSYPILTPASKVNQFAISSGNIIIIPMQLSQTAVTVPHSTGTATFAGLGGYAASYVYAMQSAPSGATINSSSGAYTAGSTNNVTDVVIVTDAFGNTATASIIVT